MNLCRLCKVLHAYTRCTDEHTCTNVWMCMHPSMWCGYVGMHISVSVCLRARACACVRGCVCIYTYAHLYEYTHAHAFTHSCSHTLTQKQTQTQPQTHTHTHTHTQAHTHTSTHTHTHVFRHAAVHANGTPVIGSGLRYNSPDRSVHKVRTNSAAKTHFSRWSAPASCRGS